MNKKTQLVSALIVFDYLYNEKEQDIFKILDFFILFVIRYKDFKSFTHIEIRDCLYEDFGFKIPRSVIEKRLKKMSKEKQYFSYSKNDQKYSAVDDGLLKSIDIKQKIHEAQQDEERLIEKLYVSISDDNKSLEQDAKEEIRQAFIEYFLGMTQGKYSQDIHRFVIKEGQNDIIRNIGNGVVLYNGLRYNNTFENRKWESLKIFINMEIIFHYAGYNGEIFQQITKELFDLIREINKKTKVISLYYTPETRERIDDFFEAVLKNVNSIKNQTDASRAIIQKCENDRIEIQFEKCRLFKKLEQAFIQEEKINKNDKVDFNVKENQEYNVLSGDLKLSDDESGAGEFLNKLSFLRKNHQCTIENAKYLFLTEENVYIDVANRIKQDQDIEQKIPLAIRIQHLTNILWFKLGKGLSFSDSDAKMPLIFQAGTRAKIIMALNFNNHKEFLYDDVANKIKDDSFNQDFGKEVLYQIQSKSIKPEEINEGNVDSIYEFSGVTLEYFINKDKKDKQKLQEYEKLSQELKNNNLRLEQENEKMNFENNNLRKKNKELKQAEIARKIRVIKICQWAINGIFILTLIIVIVLGFTNEQFAQWLSIVGSMWTILGVGGVIGLWTLINKFFNKKIKQIEDSDLEGNSCKIEEQ